MPIISNFPGGGGGGGGGVALNAVNSIQTIAAHERAYVKWGDPEDIVLNGINLASWGGTLLVRKAGSAPKSRRDGVIVLDSKVRDAYKDTYFCDGGLVNGTVYYYKFFPYTSTGTYTDSEDDEFSVTPASVPLGNVSDISTEAAGNGKLAIKWTDPASTVTQDGVTLATWQKTRVVVRADSYATDPDDEGAAFQQVVNTYNQHSSTPLIATGLENGKTYYVSIFPVSTDGAVNKSDANRATGVPNRMQISSIPAQSGSLTYTGSAQSPTWNNYNSAQLTLGGTTTGTNAGFYKANFTPSDDYMWSDGSVSAKEVSWRILKADGIMTLSVNSVTLNNSHLTATVSVTRPGNGKVYATSDYEEIATVSVSDPTGSNPVITISQVNHTSGKALISVVALADTNYNYPGDSKNHVVNVTAQFMPALNDATWTQISEASASGKGSEYWSVGDRKAVLVNGTVGTLSINQTLYVYILGFNHNSAREGSGIHFGTFMKKESSIGTDCICDSFQGKDCGSGETKYFQMNHCGWNAYGGWKACDMRYDILGSTNIAPDGYCTYKKTSDVGYDAPTNTAINPVANTLMAALPSDLREVMKPITKYTDNVGSKDDSVAEDVTSSIDYLPLLAEYEIFGSRTHANQYEQNYQMQYAYYSAGNSKQKYRLDNEAFFTHWWERSYSTSLSPCFCYVSGSGKAEYNRATFSFGLSPIFMV